MIQNELAAIPAGLLGPICSAPPPKEGASRPLIAPGLMPTARDLCHGRPGHARARPGQPWHTPQQGANLAHFPLLTGAGK